MAIMTLQTSDAGYTVQGGSSYSPSVPPGGYAPGGLPVTTQPAPAPATFIGPPALKCAAGYTVVNAGTRSEQCVPIVPPVTTSPQPTAPVGSTPNKTPPPPEYQGEPGKEGATSTLGHELTATGEQKAGFSLSDVPPLAWLGLGAVVLFLALRR